MVTFITEDNSDKKPTPSSSKSGRKDDRRPPKRQVHARTDKSTKAQKEEEEAANRKPEPRRRRPPRPIPESKKAEKTPKPQPVKKEGAPKKTPKPIAAAESGAKKNPLSSDPDKPRRRRRRSPRKKNPETSAEEKPSNVKKQPAWDASSYQVEAIEGKTRFHDLDLPVELLHAIADLGWQYCTPIQAGILPLALQGKDCTGRAQTGTGKTAAFLIAAMTRLLRNPAEDPKKHFPRILILAPTRELVKQIEKDAVALGKYTPLHAISIYGGTSYHRQREILARDNPEILIATPGRLIDLIGQRALHLNHAATLVIDEADRMLDMGFIPAVRNIIRRTPPRAQRHTLFFSATLTTDVVRLASQWLKDPEVIEIAPERVVTETVDQRIYIVENEQKFSLLYNLIKTENPDQIIIFANRRDAVFNLHHKLQCYGMNCDMISGALTQSKRERTLENFKSKKTRILIATDVAGRGLHIDDISHVINYNLPTDAEDYVHRIGRTGRAGAEGTSISFACEDESFYIPDIEEYVGHPLGCIHPDDKLLVKPPTPEGGEYKSKKPRSSSASNNRSRSRRPSSGGGRRPRKK